MNISLDSERHSSPPAICAPSCITTLEKPIKTRKIYVPDVAPDKLNRPLIPFSNEFSEKVYKSKYPKAQPNSPELIKTNNSGVLTVLGLTN